MWDFAVMQGEWNVSRQPEAKRRNTAIGQNISVVDMENTHPKKHAVTDNAVNCITNSGKAEG
jgi:hypothetical protein